MKRSEMIRIIWEAINELEDAEHILQRIEQAGMLPPFNGELYYKAWRAGITGHAWEPEDSSGAQHSSTDDGKT